MASGMLPAGGIMEQVVVPLLVTGAYDAIKAGVRLFLDRYPRGTVPIEENDEVASIDRDHRGRGRLARKPRPWPVKTSNRPPYDRRRDEVE